MPPYFSAGGKCRLSPHNLIAWGKAHGIDDPGTLKSSVLAEAPANVVPD